MAKKIPYLVDTPRLFIWLSYVPQKVRIPVTAGLLLSFLFLWKAFLLAPLRKDFQIYQESLKQISAQKNALLKTLKTGEWIDEENSELRKIVNSKEFLQDNKLVADGDCNYIDAILTVANNANIACSRIIHTGSLPNAFAYEIGLIGLFHNFLSFLQQLKNVPALVVIKKLECHRMHNQQISVHLEIEFVRQR